MMSGHLICNKRRQHECLLTLLVLLAIVRISTTILVGTGVTETRRCSTDPFISCLSFWLNDSEA